MDQLVPAIIGLIAGFFGAVGKGWLDRRTRIDEGLLAKRTELYFDLLRLTGNIPKYPRNREFSYRDAYQLSVELRNWYFVKSGGLYMSAETQRRYLDLQNALNGLAYPACKDKRLFNDLKQAPWRLKWARFFRIRKKFWIAPASPETSFCEDNEDLADSEAHIGVENYNAVQSIGSALRTAMTRDLRSRSALHSI
jgi:hypothetical protein